ncbi:MAG TPA: OmpP1/FadL family transporter [Nitrospiria bacterium]
MALFIQVFLTFVFLEFFGGQAVGAGFAVYEQGAAAMGQGDAFAARADNPSAIFYNPAGIVQLEGTQASLGATAIIVESEFRSNTTGLTTDMFQQITFPLHFFLTHPISENVSLGFGAFSPFGLKTDWPENWEISRFSYRSSVETLYINPTVAWRPHEKVMVGFGINYVRGRSELRRKVPDPFLGPDHDLNIHSGEGDGWGYNFGSLFLISERTSLGASFRSQVRIDYEGRAESSFPGFVNGAAFTTLTMPPIAVVGLSHHFFPNFALELDFQWTGWSTIQNLDLSFENSVFDTSIPRNWNDVFAIHLGGEYWFNEVLAFRAGYTFDETPIPDNTMDPILQDATRDIFSFGIGYTSGILTTDLAYDVFFLRDRDVNNVLPALIPVTQNGTYETIGHLIALSFTFIFN